MHLILNYFWQLCLLRRGPEELPGTGFALALMFVIYACLAATTIALTLDHLTFFEGILSIAIGTSFEVLMVIGILALKDAVRRFVPTMTALFGANAFILVLTLPLSAFEVSTEAMQQFFDLLSLMVFLWWLAIAGFILHRAANIGLIQGMVAIFGVEMLILVTTQSLFPMPVS